MTNENFKNLIIIKMRNKKIYTTALIAMILYLVLCSVSFAKIIGEPPQFSPILMEPQHGSTEVSLTPDVKWNEVPEAHITGLKYQNRTDHPGKSYMTGLQMT